jgi:hypothetical protein
MVESPNLICPGAGMREDAGVSQMARVRGHRFDGERAMGATRAQLNRA